MRATRLSILSVIMLLFALTLFSGQNVHAATSTAAITTDQSDYVTGSIVTIFGSGFSPSAAITVSVTDPNNSTTTWSVSSDSFGGFTTYYQLDHVNGNYLVNATDGINSASTSFHDAAAAANIDQCTNGAVGSPPESCLNSLANWVNGNANGNKAHWQEGDFIAYRVSVTGVTAGSHNIVFSWDTVHSKGHAIDYIGSVNFTETFSTTPTPFHANNNNPCIDLLPAAQCASSTPGFNSAASPAGSIAVPIANEGTAVTCDSAGGTFSGTQIPGKIFIWGPTGTSLTTLTYLSENAPSGTGQCTTTAQLNFNVGGSASSNTVVIAWGGHIATQTNWGVGNSASAISGSPYHTSLDTLDGASVGSQDRALSTTSIFFTPTISTTVINESTGLAVVSPLPLGTSVHDTATLSSASLTPTGTVTYKFYTNGACSGTPSTTQTVTLSGGLIPNSASTGPLAAGSYSYNATYSGDSINFPKLPNSACEPFKVNPAATATSTAIYKTGTKSPDLQGTTQTAGISVYDNATVSPKVDSIPITGTVTFTFYTSGDCTTGGTAQSPVTLTSSSPFSAISNSHVLSTPGSYSFRAAYSGDSNYNASISGCETIRILSAPLQPTITKTVAASFTRTYTWSISKAVDQTVIDIAFGGTATFHYTIVATGTTTDSNFQTSGTITVGNPNPGSMSITSVTDADSNGGICAIGTGSLGDSPSGPFTLPATTTESFPYTCTFSTNPGSGTDTATVTWPTQTIGNTSGTLAAGSAAFPASYSFGSATITTVGSATVTVTDTLPNGTVDTLGTCTAPTSPGSGSCTFTDSFTTSGVGGTCTSYTNTAALSTGQTASKTVQVCVGLDLTVNKTATPSFIRTFTWGISKSVDQTEIDIASGSTATFHYTITATGTSTDSAWQTSGTITVSNPNDWESISYTLADIVNNGGSCTISGGSGPFTLAPNGSATYSYTCTYASMPSTASGTNTATATVTAGITPSSSVSGTASFNFGATTPTTVGFATVSVTDTLPDSTVVALGSCSAPNPVGILATNPSSSSCTFNDSFTTSGVGGTCTNYTNTAAITQTGASANKTVTVCVGLNLTVSKTATPSFTRTFHWAISKAVDHNSVFTAGGAPVTLNYDVTVTHDAGFDSAWTITGTISVSNPNDWETITTTITDATTGNTGSCSVSGGVGVVVPKAVGGTPGSVTLSYSCTFGSGLSGTNTATATWSASTYHTPAGSASGSASFAFTTPTTIVDGSVTVTDSLKGPLGTVSYTDPNPTNFTYSLTFMDPAGTCTSHTNTATFTTNTTGTSDFASQTVTDCQGSDLTVSKTATPSFTRTYTWGISKTVDNNNLFTAGGSPATFNYHVTVTNTGFTDSLWAISGTITVSNPNNWEAITLTSLTDSATGGTCTVAPGPYVVPASSSISVSYTCTFLSGASGSNTATATWDATAASTPSGSANGSASFSFITPTTFLDTSVMVTDSVVGPLGVCYVSGFGVPPSPCTFNYSKSYSDLAGTCTSHNNTATFTTNNTGTTGSASQTVTDCQGADLTVSKTATPTFTRTFQWGISKTVDNNRIFTSGGGPGTVTYTVSVTHDSGTDSAWAITGTITVTNPNDWEAISFTLADIAGSTSCSITGGSGPYTVAASSSMSFTYSCTMPSGASGTNTATASWDASLFHTPDASASGTAPFAFTTPTTIVDGSVSVSDSVQGFIGTVSYTDASPKTFTYSQTFNDPAGTCTSHTNTATFTTNNTGTSGSSSQTVTDCQGADLTVSKTATPTFTRTFHWGISKSVNNNNVFTAGGAPATVNYDVTITHDIGTDSAWMVTGTITVTNPNNWEAITLTSIGDLASGGVCTVTPGPMTVPASSSITFSYSCTFGSGASGTNTATATWDSSAFHTPTGSASGSAAFAFTTPTTIVDGSVAVTDSSQGFLGTVLYTDPSPTDFTYSQTFTDPAGTCTTHSNTATFTTNTTGTTGSASQTVTDCQGADLTVSKTATPTFTRTFHWGISKTVDNNQIFTAGGGPGTVTYTVAVTHDAGTDSAWMIAGTITVHNPNDWEAITFNLSDSAGLGSSCSITGGTGPYTIPAGATQTYSYSCTFSSGASGTNTATATWDSSVFHTPDASASGTAPFAFTTPTTIVDGSVSVSDSVQGFIGTVSYADSSPKTFTYSQTFNDPAGTCTSHTNTATFTTNNTGTTGSSSQTVTDCQGANLTVSKTATPTFTRTFLWGISKTVDNNKIFTAGGGPGTVTYTIAVTHDAGTDSAWAVTGTITVTNPNNWEDITFNLADSAGLGSSCSISGGNGPYTVIRSMSSSFSYSCTFTSGASGTNTATATWDSSAFHTPTGSVSGSAPFAFTTPTTIVDGSVSVSDSVQGFIGTVSYTDSSPKTFTYSQTFNDPAGTCTSHTNTASFTTNTTGKTGSASVTVTDCQGADLTVSKTVTPTFTRTFTWGISKSVDKTLVYLSPSGGTTTFTYTISVTHDSGTDSLWQVSGTITVTNPNNWEAITTTVTDAVDNGGSCTVTGGVNVSVPASGSVSLPYTCTYSSAPSSTSGTNTATATWNAATYSTPDSTATGSAGFSFATPTTIVDGSVVVKDLLPNGVTVTLGTVQYTDPSPTTFTDTFTTSGVVGACTLYTNTATFTTNTTGTAGSASQTVDVCVVTSQIKTSVSPLTTSIPRTATDTATVTLSPSGQTVSGTVIFKVYGPFSSAPTSTSCSSGSLFATLGPVTIGPGVSPQSVTSPSFTPSTMGYYTVVATYNPASVANGNIVSTSCADPSETLLVSPQSQVTNTSFCPIQNNQFPLNLITDPQTPSAFKLVSTNPGQFYDNVFYFDGAGNPVSLTIAIPFPFVTQGAVPIQVSSSFGIVNGCFSPSFDATSQFTITATGGNVSSSGNPVLVLGDYSTQQLGQYVYITVTGTVPASGLVYVTVHMNYGLRSQDFNKVTTGFASGAPTGISCAVNPCAQWTSNPSVIIGSPEPYLFGVTGSLTTSYTVTSVNNFKKDPGFAGVLTNSDGSAVVGAVVKIYDSSGTLLGITTTDQNGVYLFAYKYTGPQTTFTIRVTSPAGVTQTATVSMKSNQLALMNFLFP